MKIIKTYKEPTDLLVMNLILGDKASPPSTQTIELTDDYVGVEIGKEKYTFETDGFLNIIDLSKITSTDIDKEYDGLLEEFPAVIIKGVVGNVYLDIDILDEEDESVSNYTDFDIDDTFILNNLPQDSDYTWDKIDLVFDSYTEINEFEDTNELRRMIDNPELEAVAYKPKEDTKTDNSEGDRNYKVEAMYNLSEETLVEKSDNKDYEKIIDDMFDEHEFYDLMQLYRHTPKYDQRLVTETFEKLKQYIKDYINK